MSKVTIAELYRTYCDTEKWQTLKDIEVVPRKIVEMIIEKCKKNEEALRPHFGDSYSNGLDTAYIIIRNYAESLLKQFEEES